MDQFVNFKKLGVNLQFKKNIIGVILKILKHIKEEISNLCHLKFLKFNPNKKLYKFPSF
jgi:hypothetical protein